MKIMDLSLEGIKKMIEADHEKVVYKDIDKYGCWIIYDDKQNEVCKIDDIEVWFYAGGKSYRVTTYLKRYGGGTFGIDILERQFVTGSAPFNEITVASFGNTFSFMYHKEYK